MNSSINIKTKLEKHTYNPNKFSKLTEKNLRKSLFLQTRNKNSLKQDKGQLNQIKNLIKAP